MISKIKTKKICLIFCSGSKLSIKDSKSAVFRESNIKDWMEQIPEIEIIADIDPRFVLGENEKDKINYQTWIKLAEIIYKKINDYDGFVIIHNISSIQYTASVLSFMLENLKKPVILTGSSISDEKKDFEDYEGLGFRANLINAVQIATQDIAEVALMFGNLLVRGNRAQKNLSKSLNIFETSNLSSLAKIDFGIKFSRERFRRNIKGKIKLRTNINSKVYSFEILPGVSPTTLLNEIKQSGYKGIIIKITNVSLSKAIIKTLEKFSQKIPIIIFSDTEKEELKDSLVVISNMTYETTIVKFMWTLGQTKNLSNIKKIMQKSYAGEIFK